MYWLARRRMGLLQGHIGDRETAFAVSLALCFMRGLKYLCYLEFLHFCGVYYSCNVPAQFNEGLALGGWRPWRGCSFDREKVVCNSYIACRLSYRKIFDLIKMDSNYSFPKSLYST